MHHIPAHETAVTLFARDGSVFAYKSLRAALKALGERWISAHVGPHFRVFSHISRRFDAERELWDREMVYDEYDFIMRDDFGQVVTASTFEPLLERRRWRARWSRLLDTWNGEGPVPGVSRPRKGHYYRRPKTTNERRQAELVLDEEGEVAPRATRTGHNLPNAWDEYRIRARKDRNWKRFRNTQWKENKS